MLSSVLWNSSISFFFFLAHKHTSQANLISRPFQNCLRPLRTPFGTWPACNKNRSIQRRRGGANILAWGVWLGWEVLRRWPCVVSTGICSLAGMKSGSKENSRAILSYSVNLEWASAQVAHVCDLGGNYLTWNAIVLSKRCEKQWSSNLNCVLDGSAVWAAHRGQVSAQSGMPKHQVVNSHYHPLTVTGGL